MKPTSERTDVWGRLRLIGESGLSTDKKDILRAMMEFADPLTGGGITASAMTIADRTSRSKRAVQYHLAELRRDRVIVSDRSATGATRGRRINFAALPPRSHHPLDVAGGEAACTSEAGCTGGVKPIALGGVKPVAPKHPIEHPDNIQRDGSDAENPKHRKRTSANTASRIGWTIDTGWHGINADDRQAWAAAYPLVNIDAELAKMNAWLRANPAKANKTAWARFIVSWLARSTPQPTASTPAMSPDKEAAIRARLAFYESHPQTRQAHIAALKAMDPRYAKASDASILRAMPDAMLAMPATPATTNGITNA